MKFSSEVNSVNKPPFRQMTIKEEEFAVEESVQALAQRQLTVCLLREAERAEGELQEALEVHDQRVQGITKDVLERVERLRWAFLVEYLAQKSAQRELRERLRSGSLLDPSYANASRPLVERAPNARSPFGVSNISNPACEHHWATRHQMCVCEGCVVHVCTGKSSEEQHKGVGCELTERAGDGASGCMREADETESRLLALIDARDALVAEAASSAPTASAPAPAPAARERRAAISALNAQIRALLCKSH